MVCGLADLSVLCCARLVLWGESLGKLTSRLFLLERTYICVAASRQEAAAWVTDLIDALNRSELDTL